MRLRPDHSLKLVLDVAVSGSFREKRASKLPETSKVLRRKSAFYLFALILSQVTAGARGVFTFLNTQEGQDVYINKIVIYPELIPLVTLGKNKSFDISSSRTGARLNI